MRDRETGRSRGFGFVTYASDGEAQSAIMNLNEQELDGRRLRVNQANPRSGGGGGGGGGSGFGGGMFLIYASIGSDKWERFTVDDACYRRRLRWWCRWWIWWRRRLPTRRRRLPSCCRRFQPSRIRCCGLSPAGWFPPGRRLWRLRPT
jgi:hypothetical protein